MTDQKYKDLMNGGWSYPKKESTDPEEVKKAVDKYMTDNKIDSETINKKITDGVSKIVADAPEDFDTLKEMSDWISEHEDSAAAMNSAILDNKSSIDILKNDIEPLKTEVNNNTNAISDLSTDISDLSTDMKRIFKHKNLIGNTLDYYPVFIKSGSTITCSTYDGSVSSVTEAVIEFYDKNKTKLDAYSSILSGNSSRTFTLTCDDVYYVKWKILPTIPIQMEFGDRATSYEEYIDDYNFNAIVDVNSNMSDYGLNNVFDGELVNGYHDWTNGNFVDNTTVVEIKKAISVNNGDTVSVKTEQVFEYICYVFFNNKTYVSGNYAENKNECTFMIPSGVNRVYVYFSKGKTITPSTAGHIGVYVNNSIDISNDKINDSLSVLGKCKNLLKLKVGNMTQTGITLEVDNGKIHVYGTSTENTFIHLADITLKKGVSYKLCSQPFTKGNVYLLNGTIYQNNVYTPSKDEPQTVVLNIWNGQTVDFYITPMITTNINATYDDFVPYTGDGDTLSADVAKVDERTTLNVRLTLEKGDLDENGIPVSSTEYKRTINYIKVKPNTVYTISRSSTSNLYVVGFQAKGIAITDGTATNNKFIVYESTRTNVSFITTNTTQYIKVVVKNLDLSEKITIDASNSIGETVSDNTNNIGDINSNMSDYGLNNVFDGVLEQGGIDSGTKVVKDNYVITKNKIYCSPYDFIKSKGNNLESSYACFYKSDGTYIGGLNALDGCTAPSDSAYCYVEFKRSGITPNQAGHIGVYINNQIDVLKNGKEDKYTLELNHFSKCVDFENVVNADEYFEAMVFDRSDKKKYIKVSGYRPSENAEENEISYINLGSKTLNIVGSNNQTIMFSGGSEIYDAYIKAIR